MVHKGCIKKGSVLLLMLVGRYGYAMELNDRAIDAFSLQVAPAPLAVVLSRWMHRPLRCAEDDELLNVYKTLVHEPCSGSTATDFGVGVKSNTCSEGGSGKSQSPKAAVLRFLRFIPNSSRPFACGLCGRRYSERRCFKGHLSTYHVVHKEPFVCMVAGCYKKFQTRYHVQMHEKEEHRKQSRHAHTAAKLLSDS